MTASVSAVLFPKNQAKVAAFYRDTLELPCSTSDAYHTVLACVGFDLIIHQIPPPLADSIAITAPPERREAAAIRLNFTIKNVAAARSMAARLGGQVDEAPPAWAPPDARVRLGHDPEGNIFLVQE
jgi:Glyoxalase-like domain